MRFIREILGSDRFIASIPIGHGNVTGQAALCRLDGATIRAWQGCVAVGVAMILQSHRMDQNQGSVSPAPGSFISRRHQGTEMRGKSFGPFTLRGSVSP